MATSPDSWPEAGNTLAHYGVKGMKWGVRRKLVEKAVVSATDKKLREEAVANVKSNVSSNPNKWVRLPDDKLEEINMCVEAAYKTALTNMAYSYVHEQEFKVKKGADLAGQVIGGRDSDSYYREYLDNRRQNHEIKYVQSERKKGTEGYQYQGRDYSQYKFEEPRKRELPGQQISKMERSYIKKQKKGSK